MDGTFRVTTGWRFGDQVVARLVDESGEATLHWFDTNRWAAVMAGVGDVEWAIPDHEMVGPLRGEMFVRLYLSRHRALLKEGLRGL
ncbi:hypothetical protein E3G44_004355 [Mycobacteroides abscessus]|uniref:Uncharacterized protein n=1 Tax=Mycobacteroides abscessus 21 TaxID=1299324 RepID=A0A829Q841_9MYCO|nr:hypothetical protein I543_3796 [Mycobacteroides abscessus 21]MBE5496850.1 hypothetical protein [Mycobacteroides abscessus]